MKLHSARPRAPKRSRKAAVWRRYYARMADWFDDIAKALDGYPTAQRGALVEADRFLSGVREIDAGINENQKTGRWV